MLKELSKYVVIGIAAGIVAYLFTTKESVSINVANSDQKEFENEDLKVEFREYYFSNVIAKASKTMLDCNNSKIEIKKTGTEG